MAALDIDLVLHDRLWTLIEADTGLQAALGAQLKATDTDRVIRDRAAMLPAQFPKIVIEHLGGIEHGNPASTFGQSGGGASVCDYAVPMTRRFAIRIVYERLELDQQSPTEAMLRRAIFASGRTLGVANVRVSNVSISAERRDQNSKLTGNVLRPVLSLMVSIDCRPMLSTLTAS